MSIKINVYLSMFVLFNNVSLGDNFIAYFILRCILYFCGAVCSVICCIVFYYHHLWRQEVRRGRSFIFWLTGMKRPPCGADDNKKNYLCLGLLIVEIFWFFFYKWIVLILRREFVIFFTRYLSRLYSRGAASSSSYYVLFVV